MEQRFRAHRRLRAGWEQRFRAHWWLRAGPEQRFRARLRAGPEQRFRALAAPSRPGAAISSALAAPSRPGAAISSQQARKLLKARNAPARARAQIIVYMAGCRNLLRMFCKNFSDIAQNPEISLSVPFGPPYGILAPSKYTSYFAKRQQLIIEESPGATLMRLKDQTQK